jgi:hypothetical protein
MVEFKSNNNREIVYAIAVFVIAFSLRFLVGFFTFGSVDLLNAHQGGLDAVNFNHEYNFPYYPFFFYINLFSEFLSRYLSFPIGIAYKFLPIIFDSLIAVLIFIGFFLKSEKIIFSFFAAILYALSPLSILITSIHCQWDSISLAFVLMVFMLKEHYQTTNLTIFIMGVLLAISFCMKPYTIMFLPFMFLPFDFKFLFKKDYLKKCLTNVFIFLAGFFLAFTFFLIIFKLSHFDIKRVSFLVFDYLIGHRPLIFGLNFSSSLGFLYKYKILFIFFVYIVLVYLNLRTKMNSFLCASLLILAILSSHGLAPQYIFWPLPFILMSGHFLSFLIYQFVFTPIFIAYYLIPYYSFEKYENLSTFATLKNYEWLMPNSNLLKDLEAISFFPFLLNSLLPLVMFCIFILSLIIFYLNNVHEFEKGKRKLSFLLFKNSFFWIILFIFLLIAIANIIHNSGIVDLRLFETIPHDKVYSVIPNTDAPRFLIGNFQMGTFFNFPLLLVIFLIVQFSIYLAIKKINFFCKLKK